MGRNTSLHNWGFLDGRKTSRLCSVRAVRVQHLNVVSAQNALVGTRASKVTAASAVGTVVPFAVSVVIRVGPLHQGPFIRGLQQRPCILEFDSRSTSKTVQRLPGRGPLGPPAFQVCTHKGTGLAAFMALLAPKGVLPPASSAQQHPLQTSSARASSHNTSSRAHPKPFFAAAAAAAACRVCCWWPVVLQTCAQVLLTLENLADRSQYVNARNTFTELLAYGTIPVVNENVSGSRAGGWQGLAGVHARR